MRHALETIAALVSNGRADSLTVPWHELRYQHTVDIRSEMAHRGYLPATANKMLSACQGVLEECWRLGYTTGEEYQRAGVNSVCGSTLPRGRALTSGEIRSLIEVCALDTKHVRGGRAERCDYDPETSRLTGRGNKERLTYAAGGAAAAITDWLWFRGTDTNDSAALFHLVSKSGRIARRRLNEQSVYDILGRRSQPSRPRRSRALKASQKLTRSSMCRSRRPVNSSTRRIL